MYLLYFDEFFITVFKSFFSSMCTVSLNSFASFVFENNKMIWPSSVVTSIPGIPIISLPFSFSF